jgi:hypothetical protein
LNLALSIKAGLTIGSHFFQDEFLAKRRNIDDAQQQGAKDVQSPKKKKSRGTAQEISDFFSRLEVYGLALQHPRAKGLWSAPNTHETLGLGNKIASNGAGCWKHCRLCSLGVAAQPEGTGAGTVMF